MAKHKALLSSFEVSKFYPCDGCEFWQQCEEKEVACLNFYHYVVGRKYKTGTNTLLNRHKKTPNIPSKDIFDWIYKRKAIKR